MAQAKSQSIDDETDEVVNGLQSQLDAIDKAEEQRSRGEKDKEEYDTKLSGLYDKLNTTSVKIPQTEVFNLVSVISDCKIDTAPLFNKDFRKFQLIDICISNHARCYWDLLLLYQLYRLFCFLSLLNLIAKQYYLFCYN